MSFKINVLIKNLRFYLLLAKTKKVIPNFVEYVGYCFYYPSIILGPSFSYCDFIDYLYIDKYEKKVIFIEILWFKGLDFKKLNNVVPAFKKLTIGLLYIILYIYGTTKFPPEILLNQNTLLLSTLQYIIYINIVLQIVRFKYYGAFLISESCCNISNFGYNGKDEQNHEKWDLLKQIDPFNVEVYFSFI